MSSSCCGGSAKSETTKAAASNVPKTADAATKPSAVNSPKSECCQDSPAKGEKQGCCC